MPVSGLLGAAINELLMKNFQLTSPLPFTLYPFPFPLKP